MIFRKFVEARFEGIATATSRIFSEFDLHFTVHHFTKCLFAHVCWFGLSTKAHSVKEKSVDVLIEVPVLTWSVATVSQRWRDFLRPSSSKIASTVASLCWLILGSLNYRKTTPLSCLPSRELRSFAREFPFAGLHGQPKDVEWCPAMSARSSGIFSPFGGWDVLSAVAFWSIIQKMCNNHSRIF